MNREEPMIKYMLNPFLSEKREVPHVVGGDQIDAVSFFHQSLPGYAYTPLLKLEGLAAKIKINSLILKDESQRFGLKAFKVLGASYAIAKEI
jgi:diaminopropionate ammonia-lyase